MATFKITANSTVKSFSKAFKEEFGATLQIYNGRLRADEGVKLVDIGVKTGTFECRSSRTVGSFIKMMQDEFNMKVKVRTADDWVTVIDGLTLNRINDLPKQTTKTVMEDYLSYQRKDTKPEEPTEETPAKETNEPVVDVNAEWEKSEALAGETESAAAAFHKVGDGYDSQETLDDYLSEDGHYDFFILLKKGNDFYVPNFYDWVEAKKEIDNADEVYYRYKNEIIMSAEVEDIVMDDWKWACEDYSLDDAIEDVLSGKNEYRWPAIDIDFIYNGKVFYSFTL